MPKETASANVSQPFARLRHGAIFGKHARSENADRKQFPEFGVLIRLFFVHCSAG
jgi:hypothetical protein